MGDSLYMIYKLQTKQIDENKITFTDLRACLLLSLLVSQTPLDWQQPNRAGFSTYIF
jgi:hypothetical protein